MDLVYNGTMRFIRFLPELNIIQLTAIKKLLLMAFSTLLFFQLLVGFVSFDDYLVLFVYVLFLNDLYIKIKKPELLYYHDERLKRSKMSLVFFVLFLLPFVFDAFNVTDVTRLFLYKIGFILWAQIFLLDAFIHYKQTNSKRWLIITNMAVLFIVMGSLIK
jgi:hypothetical protein